MAVKVRSAAMGGGKKRCPRLLPKDPLASRDNIGPTQRPSGKTGGLEYDILHYRTALKPFNR